MIYYIQIKVFSHIPYGCATLRTTEMPLIQTKG